ncbi:MAG: hypothetical protein IIB13_05460, partial [Chloroflexi bacterium]|nr:hypothetical protein [Chloroflexota bacterium]
ATKKNEEAEQEAKEKARREAEAAKKAAQEEKLAKETAEREAKEKASQIEASLKEIDSVCAEVEGGEMGTEAALKKLSEITERIAD